MRISDWSSDVCSSDLSRRLAARSPSRGPTGPRRREDRGMILLTDELRQTLRTNAIIREMHAQREWPEPDPCPVVKFFNPLGAATRSEEHTSELPSLMRNSYAVFCLKQKTTITTTQQPYI